MSVHGVLVVDKPRGPTSHDVVSWARRALGTRAIGHAGTLDPMATGVLVLGVGEGTKLTSYLMADDKEYLATVALGAETHTLDAEGDVVDRAAIPELSEELVLSALSRFVGTYLQRAPIVSAIKQGGVALHERARRGQDVEAPLREVACHAIELLALRSDALDLRVHCGKGFYVRSLARDLARELGTLGHLTSLRRTRSGGFSVEDALEGETLRAAREDHALRATVRARLRSLEDSLATMPTVRVDLQAAIDVGHGKRISAPDGVTVGPIAVLNSDERLVAVSDVVEGRLVVRRGFVVHPREADPR
jgi:tRNA pseudouridine55 synthase